MFLSAVSLLVLSQDTGGKSVSSIKGLHTVSWDVYLALLCVSLLSFVHVTQAQRTSSHRWGCLRERERESDGCAR